MKYTICLIIFNEGITIRQLINKLTIQNHGISEILIIDGGSQDKTVNIIKKLQRKYRFIKLIINKNCTRSEGRNIAVNNAKNEIIVMTDAGCLPKKNWITNIVKPLSDSKVDVVAGFYEMVYKNKFQKAESFFLGVLPEDYSSGFLPSTRSIAFRKSIWKKIGGFSEDLDDTAEDTMFNYRLINNKANIKLVKNAVVEWGMPNNICEFFDKIFRYAKGDAKSKIWIFPGKGITSHNIKTLFVILRYLTGLLLLILSINKTVSPIVIIFLIFIYIIYIYQKIYRAFGEIDTALLGIPLQFVADLGVISGFISGLF